MHEVGLSTPTRLTRPMPGRHPIAHAARTPASGVSLKKRLFHSSSESAASNKHVQPKIADMLKPRGGSGSASNTATAAEPLQNRSHNVDRPVAPRPSGKALASLCDKSDQFREESEVIDLAGDSTGSSFVSPANDFALVDISENDFSDDEELALQLQAPSTLPTVPRSQPRGPAQENQPPPASDTSALSWSQSSPSHLQPPEPQGVPPQKPMKRATPDDDEPAPLVPKKPKRELPKHWKQQREVEDGEAGELDDVVSARAPSATKTSLPWDTTASTVKAQKKQLKAQLKESGRAEATAEDMREAMKSQVAKTSAITLSSEQRHVKNLVVEKGQSVFFTGPAGTGKSVLMRAIIQELKKKYARDPERVAVTASTGLAACNIGGMTLHSFAGIGLGKEDVHMLVRKIRRNPKAKSRWLRTKILIIDEISMVDGELFDKLSQIGRIIRNNGRPWGGIQLVITGDFFQLPPVPEEGKQREAKFAFDAATWSMSIDHTIGLTEVFRQKDPGTLDSGVHAHCIRAGYDTDAHGFTRVRRDAQRDPPGNDQRQDGPQLSSSEQAASF